MQKFRTGSFMTALSLFGHALVTAPLWILILSSFCGTALTACCLILSAFSVCSAFLAGVSHRFSRKKSRLIRIFLLPALAGGCCCCLHAAADRLVIPAFLSFLTVLVSMGGTNRPMEKIFSFPAYLFSVTCTAVSVLLMRIAMIPIPASLMLGFVSILSACYFLLRNQFMLYRMVNRRSRTETMVPPDIQRSNLMMVSGILLLAAFVFLFHAPLLRLLKYILHLAALLIRAVIHGITSLISWLEGSPPETVTEGGMPGEPQMEGSGGEGNPLWSLLLIPFILVVIYICRLFLSDWVYYLRDLIAGFLQKIRIHETTVRTEHHAEYTDTETSAQPESHEKARKRQWKKALRVWMKQPDSKEKFYAGYQLLLSAPAWERGSVRGSDTVREIREKWAADYLPEDLLDAVTLDFHADRYECTGLPASALKDLQAALKAMA